MKVESIYHVSSEGARRAPSETSPTKGCAAGGRARSGPILPRRLATARGTTALEKRP
jgi:hypothetical protein